MATVNVVYRKIKEISSRAAKPRPFILVSKISDELVIKQDELMPFLQELQDLRLIQFAEISTESLRLTLVGHIVKR